MQAFLTQASDLAYVEGAYGVHRVLACASRLLRHMAGAGLAPLEDELKCLTDYLSICKARFGNRFYLQPFRADGLFIERMHVIAFIDEHISAERLLSNPDTEYHIDCEQRLSVSEGTKKMMLHVCVQERGDCVTISACDLPL